MSVKNKIKNKKTKTIDNGLNTVQSNNYFSPLQTIEDDNFDTDEVIVEKSTKVHVPPITILKCKIEEIHELCKLVEITDYAIRKISIGLKLFLKTQADFESMCNSLNNKYEYFTYATKNEKPYKALLFGLDKKDPKIILKMLTDMGLKCLEVKLVTKSFSLNSEYVIYVVYFQRQTISLKELRQNYSVLNFLKVRWEHQRADKSRITQCYNCQMFGHGSSRCRVKTFCAKCAGQHKTSDCTETIEKCANCNGSHKSTFDKCPSKLQYLNVKQRLQPTQIRRPSNNNARELNVNYNANFPNTLHQRSTAPTGIWISSNNGSNNNILSNNSSELFSLQEIKNITLELITNLKNCKSKVEQFEVVTSLAIKFLS